MSDKPERRVPPVAKFAKAEAAAPPPANRTNASLERENTALGLESDELKAQQITMEAHQVTMEAHQVTMEAQQVTMEAHQVTLERLVDINRALLDASVDGIRLVDLQGRTLLANSVIEHLTTEIFGLPKHVHAAGELGDRRSPHRPGVVPRDDGDDRGGPRTAPRRTTSSSPTCGAPSSVTPAPCATPRAS